MKRLSLLLTLLALAAACGVRTVTTNPATGAVSHWSGMVGETLELRCERNPADDGTFDWWRVENHRTTELLFEGK